MRNAFEMENGVFVVMLLLIFYLKEFTYSYRRPWSFNVSPPKNRRERITTRRRGVTGSKEAIALARERLGWSNPQQEQAESPPFEARESWAGTDPQSPSPASSSSMSSNPNPVVDLDPNE